MMSSTQDWTPITSIFSFPPWNLTFPVLRNHARGALNSAADLSLDVRWFYKCVSCTYTHTHTKCKYYSESKKNEKLRRNSMASSTGLQPIHRRRGDSRPDSRLSLWKKKKKFGFDFILLLLLLHRDPAKGAARSKRVGRLFSIATRHVLMDRWRIYPSANKYLPSHRVKQRFE